MERSSGQVSQMVRKLTLDFSALREPSAREGYRRNPQPEQRNSCPEKKAKQPLPDAFRIAVRPSEYTLKRVVRLALCLGNHASSLTLGV